MLYVQYWRGAPNHETCYFEEEGGGHRGKGREKPKVFNTDSKACYPGTHTPRLSTLLGSRSCMRSYDYPKGKEKKSMRQ